MIRSALVAVFLLGLIHPAKAATDTTAKVGFVDMQGAILAVEDGKKARQKLEGDFNKRKKELQDEEAAIRKLGEEFKKQSLVLNDEAKAKKQVEINEKIAKLQEKTIRSQQEIQMREKELTDPIVTKLRKVISDLAEKKGYTLVLEKNENAVLYNLEKDDMTQEVITAFNKK